MGATKANSAIVHAGFDAKEGSLKARFNVRGSEMMEQVTKELGVKYQRNESYSGILNHQPVWRTGRRTWCLHALSCAAVYHAL